MLGDTNGDFKRKLLGKTEEKVRGYRSVALSHYCGNGYAFCVMISRKLGLGDEGAGARTRNIYRTSAKAFSKWCLRTQRLGEDVLASLEPAAGAIRRQRRAVDLR